MIRKGSEILGSFQKSLFAKCILSGEHSVLRGTPALVFPLRKYALEMTYIENQEYFNCHFSGSHGTPINLLFWGLLEEALNRLGRKRLDLKGHLDIQSFLPMGGGLGASAALCVCVGRLLYEFDLVEEKDLFEFCRSLEDQFHEESSGVDIAISFYEKPIVYRRNKEVRFFKPQWSPRLYLYYTGKKGVTSECVSRVKSLKTTRPELFSQLDKQMHESVTTAVLALEQPRSQESWNLLVESLKKGQSCYESWGLVPFNVKESIDWLTSHGAQQCKLTGSGDGGYVLSLWPHPPPESIRNQMVELNIEFG